jgi:hypothetical protein
MAATAAQITQLRRMVGELTLDTYDDDTLSRYIEAYPLMDEQGEAPYTWDTSTNPAVQIANPVWVPTYDLHAAAADLWEEKAAALTTAFDFSADGASYSRSQQYDMMMRQARYHRSRRSPTSGTLVKWPEEDANDNLSWIGNLAEPRI